MSDINANLTKFERSILDANAKGTPVRTVLTNVNGYLMGHVTPSGRVEISDGREVLVTVLSTYEAHMWSLTHGKDLYLV